MTIAKKVYFCFSLGLPMILLVLGACRQIDSPTETLRDRISEEHQPESSQRIASKLSKPIEPIQNEVIETPERGFPTMGSVVSKSRNVKNFDRVHCSFGELIITQGDRESLIVKAEDRLISQIVSEVRDGTLYLYPKNNTPFVTFDRIQFDLTVKNLDELNLDGVVTVKAERLETDRLQLEATGSAQIAIDSLKANTLNVDLGGASELNLAGKVTEQTLRFSGGSRYRADRLESQTVDLQINGAGDATVWANDRLDVQINGTGNVNFYGTPDVRQEIRGVGAIQPLGGYR
jgi:Putative auto-transporter adhesin, head GIN domain